MTRREYTIEKDDDNGCWMLLEDGIGMARSKSRTVLRRLRDALWAVEGGGLVGLTVKEDGGDKRRGVVQAISGCELIVRLSDDGLAAWNVGTCSLVEPERPDKPTPWNDPAIGIIPAVALLKRVVAIAANEDPGQDYSTPSEFRYAIDSLAEDVAKFIQAREDAQPTP